ncbi:hypothetical protein ACFYPC_15425 [Streptomyces sp. NPDC005808]|uniref:hypothetical protein n=1 Tax=Streptomyces sp. NPDC005808 TaxID=3364734 RepID=UPI00367F339D
MRVERVPVIGRPFVVRAGLAAIPVASLGLLCPVPSLVIALRRGSRADWTAFGVFCAVLVAWLMELAFTPETTHGLEFADDLLLILLSMAGAAVHAWTVWPRRAGRVGHP